MVTFLLGFKNMQRTSQQTYLSVKILGLALGLIVLSHHGVAKAADWPQWRGPNRDGICSETGLLKSWPEEGPKILWELTGLGTGYSSVAVVGGRLYTMGDIDVESKKVQCVLAYDLSTRSRLWAAQVGSPHSDGGPRCTPTVDNGMVFALGTSGDVVCIDAGGGSVRWRKNFQDDLGIGKNPDWKYSESPLVDGDNVICTPGGRDAVMIALEKKTGQVVWKCSMPDIGPRGKDEAGYSSIAVPEAIYLVLRRAALMAEANPKINIARRDVRRTLQQRCQGVGEGKREIHTAFQIVHGD
jgi:hypothetical protein